MPSRKDLFINGEYYHIYTKTIDKIKIFNFSFAKLFLNLIRYYRSTKADIRYSHFIKLSPEFQKLKEQNLNNPDYFQVKIIAYALLPNHFHLLLRQIKENGIVKFTSNVLNSIAKNYNLINKRNGPIFLHRFKSKIIRSREQLIHLSRYIHLNPYSHGYINNQKYLLAYPFTSLKDYASPDKSNDLIDKKILLSEFGFNYKKYLDFVLNHADYQRSLKKIQHLAEEKIINYTPGV
jgi:putative transposase